MNFEIYSKPGCSYCDMAKEILANQGYGYKERVVGKDVSRDEFLGEFPGVRTVPQIIETESATHIGGYTELIDFLKDLS